MLYELIVRGLNCNQCKSGYIWCTDGSFVSPSRFKSSGKIAYGYALNGYTVVSLKRSAFYGSWSDSKLYCTKFNNAGRSKLGYCPSIDELKSLYYSIMGGDMKTNLTTAGLYEYCSYRKSYSTGWSQIWSSDEYNSDLAYYLDYTGSVCCSEKSNDIHVIPFFNF